MHWLIYVAISTISFSVTTILQRTLLKSEKSDPVAHSFIFQIAVAAVMFVYAITFSSFSLPNLQPFTFNIILLCIFYTASTFSLFSAFKRIDASEVAVLLATYPGWVAIGSILFLGETISTYRAIGIVALILGVMIMSWRNKKLSFSSGHWFALIGAFFQGSGFVNDAYIINNFDVPSYLVIGFLLPALTIGLLKPKSLKKLTYYANKKMSLGLITTAIFYGLSIATVLLAYQNGGDASQVSPMTQTASIFTILFGYLFLKERDFLKNKLLGAILIVGGVALLQW